MPLQYGRGWVRWGSRGKAYSTKKLGRKRAKALAIRQARAIRARYMDQGVISRGRSKRRKARNLIRYSLQLV